MIGKTQNAKELTGERGNINELDLGIYVRDNKGRGAKVYGFLWFGKQYGVGFCAEGKYKLSQSAPYSLF
jgi:hypothetical protein